MSILLLTAMISLGFTTAGFGQGPYQATGIKICEVDQTSAIVWARLTSSAKRVAKGAPMPVVTYLDEKTGQMVPRSGRQDMWPTVTFPGGSSVKTIEGAAPGTNGEVRVRYRTRGAGQWAESDWREVDFIRDYTAQIKIGGLKPATAYEVEVQGRATLAQQLGETVPGRFRTAAEPDKPQKVVFTVSTGQAYPDRDAPGGFKIYGQMLKLDPDFFTHTGDIVYYDTLAKTLPLARWHWQRTYSLPTNVEFHRQVASYFIKDDHDTLMNDTWPGRKTRFMGDFTFEQGKGVFLEQVGMGASTYRTVRWGKDLQIWMVEGRDFRSSNRAPDGPDKTIWGAEQKAWFKRTVEASDAAFRILISPTPIVGPDRTNKRDNHANKSFTHEGDELRDFIGKQKNTYVVCGDRHWQYVSQDRKTGVREYSCGPASDEHAGGWPNGFREPAHVYLNVAGGFLAVTVDRENGRPVATFRHYSVDGKVLNEDRREAR